MVHPAGTDKQRGTAAGGLTLLYHLPVELHAMAEQLSNVWLCWAAS